MKSEDVVRQLRSRRDRIVATLGELIAARTVNPPGDEHRAAAVVEAFFARLGIPYRKIEKAPGRTNIVGRIGRALPGRPRVAVVCHLDTVPAGDGWTTDPFTATLVDGKLYGRGAKDNKGPLAASMAAVEFLKEHEQEIEGQILLVGAADEECGSEFGAVFLLQDEEFRTLDAAIVPDAGDNLANIDIAEKGLVFLKIICHGRQAHGSTPAAGVNAIYPMAELISWLRRWRMPGETNDLFSPATPTRNVGAISGGAAPNMVPARCEMQLDMRYLPGTDEDQLLAAISNTIDRLERKYPGATFEIEPLAADVPTAVERESPLVVTLQQSVQDVTGRRPVLFGMSGATVAKQFIAAGVPAVGLCPGDARTEHVTNEYIPVNEVVDFAAALVLCLARLTGRG